MYVQKRNVTTEGLHVQRQHVGVEGVCVGIRLYVMDGAKEEADGKEYRVEGERETYSVKKPSPNSLAFSLYDAMGLPIL
jgi:hypothetical protein